MAEKDEHDKAVELQRLALEQARLAVDEQRLQLDRYRANLDHDKTQLEREKVKHEAWKPSFEAVIRFADLTVRSMLILTGGAALAILTFAANMVRNGAPPAIDLAYTVSAFGAAALLSVLTAAFSYLAQHAYTSEKEKSGDGFRYAAIASFVFSVGAFASGVIVAANSAKHLTEPPRQVAPLPNAAAPVEPAAAPKAEPPAKAEPKK